MILISQAMLAVIAHALVQMTMLVLYPKTEQICPV
jgi:hypothetical protein